MRIKVLAFLKEAEQPARGNGILNLQGVKVALLSPIQTARSSASISLVDIAKTTKKRLKPRK